MLKWSQRARHCMSSWCVEACSWKRDEGGRGCDIGVLIWKVRELLLLPCGWQKEGVNGMSPCFSSVKVVLWRKGRCWPCFTELIYGCPGFAGAESILGQQWAAGQELGAVWIQPGPELATSVSQGVKLTLSVKGEIC